MAAPLDADAFERYAAISEEYEDPAGTIYEDGTSYEDHVLGQVPQRRLVCVDGPFDGSELDVPPGGGEVIINAAFGRKTGLRGPVIYRIEEIDGALRLVFKGQPDQTDENHADDPETSLILP